MLSFIRPVSSFKSDDNNDALPHEYKCLFLTMPRTLLYQRIDTRCEQMIRDGLLQVCVHEVSSSNDHFVSHVNRRPSHWSIWKGLYWIVRLEGVWVIGKCLNFYNTLGAFQLLLVTQPINLVYVDIIINIIYTYGAAEWSNIADKIL